MRREEESWNEEGREGKEKGGRWWWWCGGLHGMIFSFVLVPACLITNQIHHLPLFTKRSALSSRHRNRNFILLLIVLYTTQKLNHTTTTFLIFILPLIRQR